MPPPPTLRELIDFFWAPNHPPLPTEIDPAFRDRTVAGLPICGSEDVTSRRLLGFPNDANSAIWLPPSQITSTSTFLNPDSTFLRRILTGTNGLEYQREEAGPNHTTIPGGSAALDLCRDASPIAGTSGDAARYAVYVTDNAILNHRNPGVPGLMQLDIPLQTGEIIAIVRGLRLQDEHYAVHPSDHTRFSIFPDDIEIGRVVDFVNRTDSGIDASRRPLIAAALNRLLNNEGRRMAREQATNQREGLDQQRGMRTEMRWQMIGMGLLTFYATLLAVGKAGTINKVVSYPFRGLYNLARAPFDRGEGLGRWWSDLTNEVRYRGLATVLASGTNLTEMARRGEIRPAVDSGTEVMIERIMNRISTPRRAGSAIVEAPPGWGKEVLMRNLALENQNMVFIQTQPDDLMSGTMYRGQLEEKLRNIPREIEAALQRGQRVVLCIDEFHEAISAGKSMEETRSLLERWKGPLANGTLRIVGFSTPDEMTKIRYQAGLYDSPESRTLLTERQSELIRLWEADPAKYNIRMSENIRPLLNRFRGFEAPVRTSVDMRAMLNDEIERMRTQDHLVLNIEPRTIDLIVRLSESPVSGEGFIPRNAFDLFDGVIADAAESTDMNRPIDITHDRFENYVRTSWPRVAQRFNLGPATPNPTGTPTRVVGGAADPAPRDPSTRVVTGADDAAPRPSLRVVTSGTPPVVPTATAVSVTSIFTEDSFYEMFRSRYPQFQNSAGQIHGNYETAVRAMARLAFNRWSADPAHPTTTVDGHVFPRESFVEQTFRDAIRISAERDAAQATELRRVYEAGRERLGEGRDLDTTSESFRAEGLRAFEAIGR